MDSTKHFLDQIDWQRPWLAPLLPTANPILAARDWRQAINVAAAEIGLHNLRGFPIRFVPQEELPPGMAYEAYISATGCVPTRNNLHDFFNALVWLSYPRIKVRLNALQAAEIASASEANAKPVQRGRVRDAATIFDENAALLLTSDSTLVANLRAHDWLNLFVKRRAEFQASCEVRLFGHALMEKLVAPYKAVTAHTWIVLADASIFELEEAQKLAAIDSLVASQLEGGISTAQFTPLPVLGVPGWWQGQDAAFYADSAVFRPKGLRPPLSGRSALN